MSTKHTPGPWVAEIFESLADAKVVSGFEWASKWRWDSPPAAVWRQEGGGITGLPGCIETTAANARLIAAAPELLEALEKAWPFLQEDDGHGANAPAYQDAINAAKAAIAKAKGEAK